MPFSSRIGTLLAATIVAATSACGSSQHTPPAAPIAASAPDACATSHGKAHGRLIATFNSYGRDPDGGRHLSVGASVQAWRSPVCQTVWATVVRRAAFTRFATETGVYLTYYDTKHHSVLIDGHGTVRITVSTPAVPTDRHGKAVVTGGFVGDYQYDGGGTANF